MRLIDAEKLWKAIKNRIEEYCDIADLIEIIETQPTVDAVEVVRCEDCKSHSYWCEQFETRTPLDAYCWLGEKREDAVRHGRWLTSPTGWLYCSECEGEPPCEINVRTDYCPNCGAKMDEVEE